MRASYAFADAWHLDAAPEAVRDVLVDLERYPEWWPQVRAVASLGPDEAWVVCRSTLPYTLDLVLRAVSRELPVLEVAVAGDLRGTVRFRLARRTSGRCCVSSRRSACPGCSGPGPRWSVRC
ncbi:polyketide cyclase [Nocardioides lianchengensis]|uniref:Polyketide cyclase / dehydrase and lipid transport n=1 Tax=Nocardioides lianchengensis TaxID=1045774 RepID=A0A1G6J1U4_9ACTN|nr:polyketide cyclase [Nocardioides lianchengensis]NYG12891.1 hypothetical protein [Nocardioides lianchengensis]SDC12305.1 hypothetical protein SAMN05421872_101336 [Nocardioides lianchengensis]